MTEPEQPTPQRPLAQRQQLRESCRSLALLIGLRAAARKLGIKERTALTWAHRGKWQLSSIDNFAPLRRFTGQKSREISMHASIDESIREAGDESRLYLSAATLKASHEAASMAGSELLGKDKSIGVLNAARTGDIVHGWQASRQSGTNVAVQVNVPLPSAEEIAERKAIHDKLSLIFKPDIKTD